MNLFEKRRRGPGGLSCHEVARTLQAYLDDESDPALRARMAEHLDECVRCGLEADVYRRIKSSLAGHQRPLDPEMASACEPSPKSSNSSS